MTRVVISQSMLFPWAGMLEQVRLADHFVHYDDVQYSKGSFTNRVQVKTASGMKWMTVPLDNLHLGQAISDVRIAPVATFRNRHIDLLRASLAEAPFRQDALDLADSVYAGDHQTIAGLARASMLALIDYFGLSGGRTFRDVGSLGIAGSGSERVLAIVRALGGTSYVTGHGAARYLDHEAFEAAGIAVDYMDYRKAPYPQSYGSFTPYVTGLDLVAHCGPSGIDFINSPTRPWKEFLT